MHFAFTEEQIALRDAVRDALPAISPPERVRACWGAPVGELWTDLADLGLLAIEAPEAAGGMDLNAIDWVLPVEETGRHATPGPLIETLAAIPALPDDLVESVVTGEQRVAVLVAGEPALDADIADVLLRIDGDRLERVHGADLTPRPTIDRCRRLFTVEGGNAETLTASGRELSGQAVFDRAALAASAQLIGLSRAMLDRTVEYAKSRQQFGKAIGSFQAVQHPLADALMQISFAAPAVYRAAWSMDSGHISMAKALASDAAWRTTRVALQAHGAVAYTTEYDLHLWMKRALALASAWGGARWHRARIAPSLLPPKRQTRPDPVREQSSTGEHHA